MPKKVFKLVGEQGYGIGVFSNGELLKGRPIKKYKSRKTAQKKLLI